jgi:diadenosine tetraphosphate (Ap4A) HIT family hydrolase
MGSIEQCDQEAIVGMIQIIRNILTKHPEYKDFELEMHNGRAGGQTVFHLHWHFKVEGNNTPAKTAFL